MKKLIHIVLIVLIVLGLVVMVASALTGCKSSPVVPPVIPATPTQVIIHTVMQQDWLVTVSIIGIGLGVFGFLNGSTGGLKAIAACGTVIAIVLMIQRYALWIAFLMLGGLVVLFVYTIFSNKKILTEVITKAEEDYSKITTTVVNKIVKATPPPPSPPVVTTDTKKE
jgi:hypothetical protein